MPLLANRRPSSFGEIVLIRLGIYRRLEPGAGRAVVLQSCQNGANAHPSGFLVLGGEAKKKT